MEKENSATKTEHGCFAQMLAMLVVSIGAPCAGLLLAKELAPQSDLAQTVGLLALLASLLGGALLWLGTVLLRLLGKLLLLPFRLLLRLIRGAQAKSRSAAHDSSEVPSGTVVFWPVTTVVCLIAGLIIGALSETVGMASATAIFTGVGFVHGLLLWILARNGYLDWLVELILNVALE